MGDNTLPPKKRRFLIRKPAHDGYPAPEDKRFKEQDPDGLIQSQRIFVEEYLVDMDAIRAAKAAGMEKKDAVFFLQNPLIKTAIARRQNELMQKTVGDLHVTQERVVSEIAKLAFANVVDMIEEHPTHGKVLKDLGKLTDMQKAAIKQFDFRYDKDAKRNVIKKIKLHDKQVALDALAKHLGLFEADNRQKAPQIDIDVILNMLPFPQKVIDGIRLELARRFRNTPEIVMVK